MLIINLKYQSTHSVYRRFVVISLGYIKIIGENTGSRITGLGQFLRSVRGDEFGSCQMGFDRKTEVILTRLRTGHVELNTYLYRFNMCITNECNFCKVPEDVVHYLMHCHKYSASRLVLFDQLHSLGFEELSLGLILGGS